MFRLSGVQTLTRRWRPYASICRYSSLDNRSGDIERSWIEFNLKETYRAGAILSGARMPSRRMSNFDLVMSSVAAVNLIA